MTPPNPLDRRDFLKSSAALSAALAGVAAEGTRLKAQDDKAPAAESGKKSSANDVLRVAVIGVRGRGMDHVNGFLSQPDCRITTICDADLSVTGKAEKAITAKYGSGPKIEQDLRKVLEDKEIDIVSFATPNHWHALGTIWACQAGKDVYVEKPVSHNVLEGRRMVEAARKYKRIVQTGTQCRSHKGIQSAMEFLHSGKLGQVFLAKGLCYKRRDSIGFKDDSTAPESLNYDLWTGPAEMKPFNANRLHYNWHWYWNTGNGDLGNQGIHQMDLARWGLNKREFPRTVMSSGGRLGYKDQAETPNTQFVAFEFPDALLQFEVRGRDTNDELGVRVGDIFYGTEGVLAITSYTNWQAFMGNKLTPGEKGSGGGDHYRNFVDAVKARDHKILNGDIEEGHLSSAFCHLGNISYRLGRKLAINPATESFINDSEADQMLTREYRKGFEVPDVV
jgi:predicted dehydrogenase